MRPVSNRMLDPEVPRRGYRFNHNGPTISLGRFHCSMIWGSSGFHFTSSSGNTVRQKAPLLCPFVCFASLFLPFLPFRQADDHPLCRTQPTARGIW